MAIHLLTLTRTRLSETLNLKWGEVGELTEDGASARLDDSKTGPRTIWLGPEAARLVEALPRPDGREGVFPNDLAAARLYTFWRGIRDEAGLPSLRIHACRHTWASQGVMNGVGLHHRRPIARTPQARDHRDLRPSRRRRHRARHGV